MKLRPSISRSSTKQGQILAEIDGFAMRRIADFEKALEENRLGRFASRSNADQPIEIKDPPGIPPQEGARALTRILLSATPTAVVAVAQPPEEFDARDRLPSPRVTAAPASTAAFSGAASGEGIEATLASWWQELLGVEQVRTGRRFLCAGRSFSGRRAPVCQDQEDLAGRSGTCRTF